MRLKTNLKCFLLCWKKINILYLGFAEKLSESFILNRKKRNVKNQTRNILAGFVRILLNEKTIFPFNKNRHDMKFPKRKISISTDIKRNFVVNFD